MKTTYASLLTLPIIFGLLFDAALVYGEEAVTTTVQPHRHRHERHRNRQNAVNTEPTLQDLPPLPLPRPLPLPFQLEVPVQPLEAKSRKIKKHSKQVIPPSYLTLVYENLLASSEGAGLGDGQPNHRPIVRALRPKKIAHGILGTSVLVFKLNRAEIGVFNSAQIIFTLKDGELDLAEGSHITVNARFRHREETKSKMIWQSTRFYEFDFTSFLQASFNSVEVEKEKDLLPFKLEVIVFKNNRRKQVSINHVFNTGKDKPFLFLQYQDNLPISEESIGSFEDDNFFMQPRKRRSLTAPSTEEPEVTDLTEPATASEAPSVENDIFVEGSAGITETGNSSTTIATPDPSSTKTRSNFSAPNTTPDSFPVEVRRTGQNRTSRPKTKRRNGKYGRLPYLSANPVSSLCRRYDWQVKPADVGLSDVVFPALLDLGFCAGTCPFPLENDVFNFTLHSYFVDMHRLLKGFDAPVNLPHASCVPLSYKELMVLEAEGSGYVVYIHQDGAVASCGCR